jgi:FAD/FMN-containing dehydrogenase
MDLATQPNLSPNDISLIVMYAYMMNMTPEDFSNSVLPSVELIQAMLDPSTNPNYNLPHKVLFPEVAGDIVAAVEFATNHSVEISVKNSGHHYAGASTKKDTLMLNMRQFRKYSPTGIVDCGSSSSDSGDELTCAYTNARNVPGYIRVGGGQTWEEVYVSVKAYNEERGADGYKFIAVGGASASVAPMGWTWQGGLAGTTNGRKYGFGVDQVVGIEAVLPNGLHVKFLPTEWEDQEDLLYPKVTVVSGYCNKNPSEADESNWIWETCPPGNEEPINFNDLWFAFLGGGGGTYGIVTSVYLQLHEYPGLLTWYGTTPAEISTRCGIFPQEYLDLNFEYHLWNFIFDFLHDPSAVGVSEEDSNSCAGANGGFLICYGDSASAAFASAWENFILDVMSKGTSEMESLSPCKIGVFKDWMETLPIIPDGQENSGRGQDLPQPDFVTEPGRYNVLVPREWMMSNKDRAIELIAASTGPPYLAFGGDAAIAHDASMTSLSQSHREAGMMLFLLLENAWEFINEMYDLSNANNMPAYLGGNHYNHYAFGPLKNSTTTMCNVFEWTREKVEEYCLPIQTVVYGSKNLARLESIKNNIDPNYLLDCSTCVGNGVVNNDKNKQHSITNGSNMGQTMEGVKFEEEEEDPVEEIHSSDETHSGDHKTPTDSSGSHSTVLSSSTKNIILSITAASFLFL